MEQQVEVFCDKNYNSLQKVDTDKSYCKECDKIVYKELKTYKQGACVVDNTKSNWPRTYHGFLKRFLIILILVFGSDLFTNVYAQNTTATIESGISYLIIKGHISSDEENLAFAIVSISSDEDIIKTYSDIDGNYVLKLPLNFLKNNTVQVEAYSIGCDSLQIEVEKPGDATVLNLDIELNQGEHYVVGIMGPRMIDPYNTNEIHYFGREIEKLPY